MGARHTVLPKEIVTDAACSGACIFWNPREVIRTDRVGSTPREVNTVLETNRLTLRIPYFISTSKSLKHTGNQDVVSTRRSVILKKGRNADPLDTPINRFSSIYGNPMPIFSKVIGPKTVSGESVDVYARKRMEFVNQKSKLHGFGAVAHQHNR